MQNFVILIFRVALEIMSVGYNSRTLSFPEEKLQEILLYRDIDQIRIDSRFFGFMYTNGNIFFEKEKFQNTDKIVSCKKHIQFNYFTFFFFHQFKLSNSVIYFNFSFTSL